MVQEAHELDAFAPAVTCHDRSSSSLNLPALYLEHFDLVWRNLRRLGVPTSSLDDAVQDVFLVVHRRQREFLGQSSTKTWILGIVLRVAHDHRRSQRRHSARVAKYAEQTIQEEAPIGPSAHVEMREAAQLVRTILEQFGEQERNVFVLVELEEMSLREAAEVTGLSLSTCQRRLVAARRAFDAALARNSAPLARRAPHHD